MDPQPVPPAFISVAPLGGALSTSAFTHRCNTHISSLPLGRLSVARSIRARRPRWVAVAGGAPPPLSPDEGSGIEDDENDPQRSDDGTRDAEFNLELTTTPKGEENELFKFIQSVPPPDLVRKFTESAPPVVQKAIRETLVSMLGSLPPLAFYTTVSSMSANLVQLFHSTLITGYMFRNAAYRLELTRTLDVTGGTFDASKLLPGTDTQPPEIRGGTAVFKQSDGSTIEVPVEQYIGELKDTVSKLQDELTREREGGNELLSFVSTMDKDNLDSLTKNASKDVIEAMKKVVDFVTVNQGINSKQNTVVEASSPELGQLLFYLMVSGFFLREAEVRRDLQKQLGGENTLGNLLQGGMEPDDSSPSPDVESDPTDSPPSSPSS